ERGPVGSRGVVAEGGGVGRRRCRAGEGRPRRKEVEPARAPSANRNGRRYTLCHRSCPVYQEAATGRVHSTALGCTASQAAPRGASSHLYPAQTTQSAQSSSRGIQPAAWVTSSSTGTAASPAAARSAPRSTTAPSADCTTLTATRSCRPTSSASPANGTSV